MPNSPAVHVELTPYFIREVKALQKKYRHVGSDLKTLTDRLEAGATPGDQVPGVRYPVYKERLPNRDAQRGQSGGYRVVYYVKTSTRVVLITMYSKSEQTDISPQRIRELIEMHEQNSRP